MKTLKNTTDLFSRKHTARLLVCAAGAALIATPVASAQSDRTDYEWEAGEGLHEEEWYDPTDWIDDDERSSEYGDTIDYEYDDKAVNIYWDGYYDGFYDTEFGVDHWSETWGADYGSVYTDGYYDGFYDNTRNYSYDPIYYVYSWEDNNTRVEMNRERDETRQRGDRASKESNATDRAKKANRDKSMDDTRVRDTVATMERVKMSDKKVHTVVRFNLEARDELLADFGPNMAYKKIPIKKGERVTLVGDMVKRDGKKVLIVEKILNEGRMWNLREDGKTPERDEMSRRNSDRRDRARPNPTAEQIGN